MRSRTTTSRSSTWRSNHARDTPRPRQGTLRTEPTHELLTTLNGLLRAARRLEQEKARFSRQTWAENLALLERRLASLSPSPLTLPLGTLHEEVRQLRARTQAVEAAIQEVGLP